MSPPLSPLLNQTLTAYFRLTLPTKFIQLLCIAPLQLEMQSGLLILLTKVGWDSVPCTCRVYRKSYLYWFVLCLFLVVKINNSRLNGKSYTNLLFILMVYCISCKQYGIVQWLSEPYSKFSDLQCDLNSTKVRNLGKNSRAGTLMEGAWRTARVAETAEIHTSIALDELNIYWYAMEDVLRDLHGAIWSQTSRTVMWEDYGMTL